MVATRKPPSGSLIARLVVGLGMTGSEQVEAVLADQPADLGAALAERGLISRAQLEHLRGVRGLVTRSREEVEHITQALRAGRLSPKALQRALTEHARLTRHGHSTPPLVELMEQAEAMEAAGPATIEAPPEAIPEAPPAAVPETPPEAAPETPPPGEVKLEISLDALQAWIYPGPQSLEAVKAALDEHGVVFGVVNDEAIRDWLSQPDHRLLVAEGQPATGIDATLELHFDTNPRGIGHVREDGTIDFDDRGSVTCVEAGAVLAIKQPAAKGAAGQDVYGVPVESTGTDVPVRAGCNVVVSEDGLTFTAAVAGEPVRLADGTLCCFPEHRIDGNVGPATGHVTFDGLIRVIGGVQPGFEVRGGSLQTEEVLRAQVDCRGDVVVCGGIVGAHVKTEGSLKAAFVRDSTLEVAGDVIVQRDIMESQIRAGGQVLIPQGRIVATRISARSGIVVDEIGSSQGGASDLRVGVDEVAEAKLSDLERQGVEAHEAVQADREQLTRERSEADRLEVAVVEQAQVLDRLMVLRRERGDAGELAEQNAEEESKMDALFTASDRCGERIEGLVAAIERHELRLLELKEEVVWVRDWIESRAKAELRSKGKIWAGTRPPGDHAHVVPRRDIFHPHTPEIYSEDEMAWRMRVRG